jgi:isopentenyldiphosphate isomerase
MLLKKIVWPERQNNPMCRHPLCAALAATAHDAASRQAMNRGELANAIARRNLQNIKRNFSVKWAGFIHAERRINMCCTLTIRASLIGASAALIWRDHRRFC